MARSRAPHATSRRGPSAIRHARSRGVMGREGDRNSMSLVNLRYYASGRFFWDERARTLEQQVLQPIENPLEMGHDLEKIVVLLREDALYPPLFAKAFGDPEVTRERLGRALAQFLRALVSYRSKFDEGMIQAGSIFEPFPNFDRAENLGKTIFLGEHDRRSRGNCATCHLRNFAFFLPRDQARQQAIFYIDQARNNGLDPEYVVADNGLGDLSLALGDFGRFKSPTLRNVELTAPYMHDGRFQTLDEVIDHYNTKVQPHPNLDPQLLNAPGRGDRSPRLMNLDAEEKAALVAFLKTLTDRPFVHDAKFSDPFRSRRTDAVALRTTAREVGGAGPDRPQGFPTLPAGPSPRRLLRMD